MAALPNAVTLANIGDGAPIVAADHRNNYSAVQTFLNSLQAILAAGTSGQVLTSGGGTTVSWASPASTLRKVAVTDVVNTVAATDLLAGVGTLPVLATTSIVRCTLVGDYLNNSGAGSAITLEAKLGATTVWKDTILSSANSFASATRRPFRVQLEIVNQGSVSSQQAGGYWWLGADDAPTTGTGGTANGADGIGMGGIAHKQAASPFAGSSSEDTSTSKTLTVNVTHGVAAATISCRCLGALVEVI